MHKKILSALVLTPVLAVAMGACTEKEAKVTDKADSSAVQETPAPENDVVVEEADVPEDDVVVEEAAEAPADENVAETATLGDTVEVGDWSIKVTEVAMNANAAIENANSWNDKPKGQFVLVTYEATYNGTERTADAWMDLTWTFTGNDLQILDESSQVTPADNQSWPSETRKGGTVRQQVVFDVLPKLLDGSILSVEGYDADFNTVYADFAVN